MLAEVKRIIRYIPFIDQVSEMQRCPFIDQVSEMQKCPFIDQVSEML